MEKEKNRKIKIKQLPWGTKVHLELPIFKGQHKFFARLCEDPNFGKYIEFVKFGPNPSGKGVYSQKLRIYKPYHWNLIKEYVERELAPAIGWSLSSKESGELLNKFQQITSQLESKEKKLRRSKKKIKEQENLIEELVNNISYYKRAHFKNKIPEYKKIIESFKKLIDESKSESVYQKFLEKHYWMFGFDYVTSNPQRKSGSEDIPDFTLERYDGFMDIIELKKPSHQLFVNKGNKIYYSRYIKDAISEIMAYLDYYSEQYKSEYYDTKEDYYKAKGIIVIGRTEEKIKRPLKQLNSYLHGIEILTYDDLVERAKKIIKFFEKQ